MSFVYRGAIVLPALACLACSGSSGGQVVERPDARPGGGVVDAGVTVDAAPPQCLTLEQRAQACTADVAMRIVDFTTGAPVPAEVGVTTAWDVTPPFPVTCPVLATLSAGSDGMLTALAPCNSPLGQPVLLFLVGGGDRAQTGWDLRLECRAGDPICGMPRGDLAVPSAALVAEWRAALAAGGMPAAATRGLVLFLFKETGGAPAAGVRAAKGGFVLEPFAPGVEVRYVADDRRTLLPPATDGTGASGLALLGLSGTSENVAGIRGDERWAMTGVLLADGWLFLEDKTKTP